MQDSWSKGITEQLIDATDLLPLIWKKDSFQISKFKVL